MHAASKEFYIGTSNAQTVEMASRRALASEKTARGEAQKVAFAVEDVISLSDHPQRKLLYNLLLPATQGRIQVAKNILASPLQQYQLRDTIAFPLQRVLDPMISNRPWYERLHHARNIAQIDSALMKVYTVYEMEQEYAKRRDINATRMSFIDSFIAGAQDVPLLQQRLREVQYFGTYQPLDIWIKGDLRMLHQLPISDLQLIADHPTGGRLLSLYEQFDRMFSRTSEHAIV